MTIQPLDFDQAQLELAREWLQAKGKVLVGMAAERQRGLDLIAQHRARLATAPPSEYLDGMISGMDFLLELLQIAPIAHTWDRVWAQQTGEGAGPQPPTSGPGPEAME